MSIVSSEYLSISQQPDGSMDVTEKHVGSEGNIYYRSSHLAPGTNLTAYLADVATIVAGELADAEAQRLLNG